MVRVSNSFAAEIALSAGLVISANGLISSVIIDLYPAGLNLNASRSEHTLEKVNPSDGED